MRDAKQVVIPFFLLWTSCCSAFQLTPRRARVEVPATLLPAIRSLPSKAHHLSTRLYAATDDVDQEIQRLRSMAAQLRAEAAQMEAQQALAMADAAEKAFKKLDSNQDGVVSLEELKAGLEKSFKMELSDSRVRKLMEDFDKSGDGVLQPDEFVGLDKIRSRLDALAREEKSVSLELTKAAQMELEAVKLLQANLELINDRPPTAIDKVLSVLPYLFPLLDGLQFGSFLVLENPDNPLSSVIALLYLFYRSIPFGGLVAFFALSFLSGNPRINRLIRFNMQQAIFLDIALFFPGLVGALYSLLGGGLPPEVTELSSDALFVTLVGMVGYCTVSSLLGVTPDKIPLISDAVNNRMPSLDMFDDQGRFQPRQKKDDKDKKD